MQSIKLVQVKIGESPIPGLPKKSISLSECSNFDRNQAVRKSWLNNASQRGKEREPERVYPFPLGTCCLN